MPSYPMTWHPLVINTVPREMLAELARYIDHGNIHSADWFVRQVLQFHFRKIANQASEEQIALQGCVLRAVLLEAPAGCYGSVEATETWSGLKSLL